VIGGWAAALRWIFQGGTAGHNINLNGGKHMFLETIPTWAYLDPGTGSYVIQVIIGGIVAGGAVIKMYWKKIKSFFIRNKDSKVD
jgi:hypothetical protein